MLSIKALNWNSDGLIPAIVQDDRSGKVLMMAWVSRESLEITVREGYTCFYSRSRQTLWRKGEISGNTQQIVSIAADCDNDTLLIRVIPAGPACHTGEESCFFRQLTGVPVAQLTGAPIGQLTGAPVSQLAGAPMGQLAGESASKRNGEAESKFTIDTLYQTILSRKANLPTGSYTTYLFEKGIDKILKKVGEENAEVIIAAKNAEPEPLVGELADLCYHVLVLMAQREVTPESVLGVLADRHKPEPKA